MNIFKLFSIISLSVLLFGCSTGGEFHSLSTEKIENNSSFIISKVTNESTYKNSEIDVEKEFKNVLEETFKSKNAYGDGYYIDAHVKQYYPGNAALAAIPIFGVSQDSVMLVECYILNKNNVQIAKITAASIKGLGGLFLGMANIGAWKRVMYSVAEEIYNKIYLEWHPDNKQTVLSTPTEEK